ASPAWSLFHRRTGPPGLVATNFRQGRPSTGPVWRGCMNTGLRPNAAGKSRSRLRDNDLFLPLPTQGTTRKTIMLRSSLSASLICLALLCGCSTLTAPDAQDTPLATAQQQAERLLQQAEQNQEPVRSQLLLQAADQF